MSVIILKYKYFLTAVGSEKNQRRLVTSFTLKDLVDGHIHYVQSDHRNKEPTLDAFLLHVSDGVNQSPTYKFNITINVHLVSRTTSAFETFPTQLLP